MNEQELVNSIVEYIQMRGGVATRINAGGTAKEGGNGKRYFIKLAPKGTADIIACYKGEYIAIECKMPGNKTSAAQDAFLSSVLSAGGKIMVVFSLEDVIKLLDYE